MTTLLATYLTGFLLLLTIVGGPAGSPSSARLQAAPVGRSAQTHFAPALEYSGLVTSAPDSTGADISGTWVGKLLQNPGGVAPEFEFTMEIQHNGIFVKGTSFVRYERIWVEMAFSGHRTENGNIEIIETEILRSQKPDDLAWCMKEYKLRTEYTREGLILIGPWWGNSLFGPCIPGSVRLVRKVKTA